jgi:hypothetical protein
MKVTLQPSPPKKKVLEFPVIMRHKTPEIIVLFTSETKGVYLQGPGVTPGYRSDCLFPVHDEQWEFYTGTVTLENDK